MNTHKTLIYGFPACFRSQIVCGAESRLLAKTDPDAFTRRYELDPRASEEDLEAQKDFLEKYHADRSRYSISRLLGIDTVAKEGRMQTGDSRVDRAATENEARIRALLLTTDPKEFKDSVDAQFKNEKLKFMVDGTTNIGQLRENTGIELDVMKNAYWNKPRTETEIAELLEKNANIAALNLLGISAPDDAVFDHFTKEQAKIVAKYIMIHYTRGLLATGMVGEPNIRQAQYFLRKKPWLMASLEGHKEDKKLVKAKKDMINLLDDLKKIATREPELDFGATKLELKNIINDLQPAVFIANPSVFVSKHFTDRYPAGGPGIVPPANTKEERKEGDARKKELEKDVTYYRQMADLLDRIHSQMGKIDGLTWPTTTSAAPLFSAGNLQDDKLNAKTNPGLISDDLKQAWTELTEEVKHDHPTEAPKGVRAVTKIFADNFKEENGFIDDQTAKVKAFRTFFRNEMTKRENALLEAEIERATGGRLSVTRGIGKGIMANVKAPFVGSDEAFICRIAESPDPVTGEPLIPRASGTAATTWRHKGIEAATLAGAAAGVNAGAIALMGGAAFPTLSVTGTTATAIGGILGVGGVLASLGVGYYMTRACASNASKARKGWKKAAWGVGSALSVIGGLGAAAGSVALATGQLAGAIAAGSVALATAPAWAVGASAGLAGYGIVKATGLDRSLFGTRTLGWFWPRQGARPAWGDMKDPETGAMDRRKLKIVWNALLRGLREGKLSNSWYVKSQVKEVGRLMLMNLADEMGEDMALQDMSEEDWKNFSMENKRLEMQRQIHEMVRYGVAGSEGEVDELLVRDSKKAEIYATNKQAGIRRRVWNVLKGPVFGAYDEKKPNKHDDSAKPPMSMAA